jgi:ABC-type nickel/cobalt efflux system permease component RcnA
MVAALIVIGILAVMFFSTWMVLRSSRSFLIRAVRTLPASSFPERADVYVCDKCARDVTKHFRLRQSHSWTPMGPTRFVCRCGQRYLTGAVEWDHLGSSERHRRVWQTLWLGVLLSGMFSIVGTLIYLPLRFLLDLREAGFLVALFITALPFVWLQMTFWPEVLASMWRTRIGSSIEQT